MYHARYVTAWPWLVERPPRLRRMSVAVRLRCSAFVLAKACTRVCRWRDKQRGIRCHWLGDSDTDRRRMGNHSRRNAISPWLNLSPRLRASLRIEGDANSSAVMHGRVDATTSRR